VVSLLKYFTFRTREQIDALAVEVAERPFLRTAQRALADDITTIVHGVAETARVVAASKALFGSGDLTTLDSATLDAALREVPGAQIAAGSELPSVVDLLVVSGLAESRGAARRTISEGGAYVNNERVLDADAQLETSQLLGKRWVVLRRGKRQLASIRVDAAS
jgi:tyrosyl-tRNA synthetase